jgi:hypothetical protein
MTRRSNGVTAAYRGTDTTGRGTLSGPVEAFHRGPRTTAGALAVAGVAAAVLLAAAFPLVAAGGLTLLVVGLGARRLVRRGRATAGRASESAGESSAAATEQAAATDDAETERETGAVDPTDADGVARRETAD